MSTLLLAKINNVSRQAYVNFYVAATSPQQNTVLAAARKVPKGCQFHDAVQHAGSSLITQLINAMPLLLRWGLAIAGALVMILAFTGKLGKVGSLIGGLIGGALLITMGGSIAGIISPDKCG